jgi:hypothetical protein
MEVGVKSRDWGGRWKLRRKVAGREKGGDRGDR